MTIMLRFLAWCLAAAVTFATLGPARDRPHAAILTHAGEHAFAFILIGLAFGLAYPRDRSRLAAISVVLIGVLELLQLWVPGRHARLEDFVVDALTAIAGILIAALFDRLHSRRAGVSVS
jgi:VanZ family protein